MGAAEAGGDFNYVVLYRKTSFVQRMVSETTRLVVTGIGSLMFVMQKPELAQV